MTTKSSKRELKSCPFCGGKATYHYSIFDNLYYINCENKKCGMLLRTQKNFVEKSAIKAWNRRSNNVR